MLLCLKARFSAKSIYTYAGTILIAVNPYYFYQIYNPKYTGLYQGKALDDLPPHIFAIADRYSECVCVLGFARKLKRKGEGMRKEQAS